MVKAKLPRKKKCRVCKQWFQPKKQFQETGSIDCAMQLIQIKRKKKEAKEHKQRKADLKPMSHWLNITQKEFNQYIRLRDHQEPCISCGILDCNKWCAGHYRTRGAASQLRFDEDNVHKQCDWHCNMNLSGNIVGYRPRLIAKIGLERVEALENNNDKANWTREQLAEIRSKYKAMSRVLKEKIGHV